MGNLGPEEIYSGHVCLCHYCEPSTRFAFRSSRPFAQAGFVPSAVITVKDISSSAGPLPLVSHQAPTKLSKVVMLVDSRFPPQYSYCEIIISSVGKFWVLPYLCIIFYQLRTYCGHSHTVWSTYPSRVCIPSDSDLHARQNIPAAPFYPTPRSVATLIYTSD